VPERDALQQKLAISDYQLENALESARCLQARLDALAVREPTEEDLSAVGKSWVAAAAEVDWRPGIFRACRDRLLSDAPAPPAATEASAAPNPTDCRYLPRWDVTCNRGTQGCGLVHDEPKP
jgi:hypothetical protein